MKLSEDQIARVKFLEDDRGGITADAVVEDARKKDSPLHDLFDWDKTKAAQAWWLECARAIIREVKVVITTTTATVHAPFYTRDPDAKGQGYRSVVALQRDESAARQALINELTRAAGNVTRARHLAIVLNLADEVDGLLESIVGLQHRVESEAVPQEARPS